MSKLDEYKKLRDTNTSVLVKYKEWRANPVSRSWELNERIDRAINTDAFERFFGMMLETETRAARQAAETEAAIFLNHATLEAEKPREEP